jgi:crotonobetainyl-CoA:carnitine CoA-transferase CaiB-like acyl-CoA transferase
MTPDPTDTPRRGPLAGLRVLDLSTVVAGPFAAALLADYGADVLKVEMPGAGDALRALPPHKDGVPLWWKVTNRNKKGITLDLHSGAGRDLLAKIVAGRDVLVENFRPGTLDRWGVTREWLQAINPRLTILRVTGFGRPGRTGIVRARVFEAMSGSRACAARKAARRCTLATRSRTRSAAVRRSSACSPRCTA